MFFFVSAGLFHNFSCGFFDKKKKHTNLKKKPIHYVGAVDCFVFNYKILKLLYKKKTIQNMNFCVYFVVVFNHTAATEIFIGCVFSATEYVHKFHIAHLGIIVLRLHFIRHLAFNYFYSLCLSVCRFVLYLFLLLWPKESFSLLFILFVDSPI